MKNDSGRSPGAFDNEQGFVRLAGFLTSSEVAEANAVCAQLLQLPAGQRCSRDKPSAGTRHLAELHDRSEFFAHLVARAELSALVVEILGADSGPDEVGYRCPQPGSGYQRLHADGMAPTATAIVALTDFTAQNGATRVVPGSHLRPDLRRRSGMLEDHADEVVLTAAAGTLFVLSGHVLHSGTQNNSASDRPALHIVWRS